MTAALIVAALIAIAVIAVYNTLVRAKVRVRQAWAQVAVQLQRRHDLIPNLVAVVGGYAAHERALLDEVVRWRAEALAAAPATRGAAEDGLSAALGRLLALAENYPDLRADAGFHRLQEQLSETEDRIAFARGFANSRVATYRRLIQTFPLNLIAGLFRFPQQELFALEDPRAAAAPGIDLPPTPEH